MASRRKSSKPKRRVTDDDNRHSDVQPVAKAKKTKNRLNVPMTRGSLTSELNSTPDPTRQLLCHCLLNHFDVISTWTDPRLGIEQLSYPASLQAPLLAVDDFQSNLQLLLQLPRQQTLPTSSLHSVLVELELTPLLNPTPTSQTEMIITDTITIFDWCLVAVRSASLAGVVLLHKKQRTALRALVRQGAGHIAGSLCMQDGKLKARFHLIDFLPRQAWLELLKLLGCKEAEPPSQQLDVLNVFDHLRNSTSTQASEDCSQPALLQSTMYGYQRRGLAWMLKREQNASTIWPSPDFVTLDQAGLYFHRSTKWPVVTQPTFEVPGGMLIDMMGLGKSIQLISLVLSNPLPLADAPTATTASVATDMATDDDNSPVGASNGCIEPALTMEEGEDVEMFCYCGGQDNGPTVQCIGCHAFQHVACAGFDATLETEYRCEACLSKSKRSIKTTIIVSPQSIAKQWIEQVTEHCQAGALKVLLYKGLGALRPSTIRPAQLAQYDIVVVSYQTFQTEIRFVNASDPQKRRTSRFLKHRSPLTMVKFWRVCLDEAQLVENPNKAVSVMANKLDGVHKWCITGTPMSKSVDDLLGLFEFLGLADLARSHGLRWLAAQQHGQASSLCTLLEKFCIRRDEADVMQELNIPSQTEQVHKLKLNAVEKFFYEQLHSTSEAELAKAIQRLHDDFDVSLDTSLKDLPVAETSALERLVGNLRMACCHAGVAKGNRTLGQQATKPISMAKVFERLVDEQKRKCQSSNRDFTLAKHALAGLAAIDEDYDLALRLYREVLVRLDDLAREIKVDNFQLIHALHNFLELAPLAQEVVSIEELAHKRDRLAAIETQLASSAMDNVQGSWDKVKALQADTIHWDTWYWFVEAIKNLGPIIGTSSLVQALRSPLEKAPNDRNHIRLHLQLNSATQITATLVQESDKLKARRHELLVRLEALQAPMSPEAVKFAATCPDCRSMARLDMRVSGGPCDLCKCIPLLEAYEPYLFGDVIKMKSILDTATGDDYKYMASNKDREQNRRASHLLLTINNLFHLVKSHHQLTPVTEAGLKMSHVLTKEFLELRQLWIALWERISILDELEMARHRLELAPEGMTDINFLSHYITHPEQEKLEQTNLAIVADAELTKHRARLRFLREQHAGNTECPVCQDTDAQQFVVLACAHRVCFGCSTELQKGNKLWIKCPFRCVIKTPVSKLQYTTSSAEPDEAEPSDSAAEPAIDSEPPVSEEPSLPHFKGQTSTKVQAVVQLIQRLRAADASNQVVVFSQWHKVLQLLKTSCLENNVTCGIMTSSRADKALARFKADRSQAAICLTLRNGAQGLNLVEANHVVLLEPLMHPGVEAQAISRVHRVGQTRETVVHRFVVADTVEVAVRAMASSLTARVDSKDSGHDLRRSTLEDLKQLLSGQAASDAPTEPEAAAAPSRADCESYWQRVVVWRHRSFARSKVVDRLMTAWAADHRHGGADIFGTSERVQHYGRDLPPSVLLELEACVVDDDVDDDE
eukprot:m.277382 g.277382  ORF g.277382 m.277382 type:complete len:1498 (-) comp17705_c0_seq18:28-4521(-)